MDFNAGAMLAIAMRWLHVVSFVTLIGSFIYIRFVAYPALAAEGGAVEKLNARFKPLVIGALAGVVISGLYNYLTKTGVPKQYHMWMGIKLLLVLHVIATVVLHGLKGLDPAKRARRAASLVVTGLLIFAVSGYLRWMSLHPAAGVR